MTCEDIGKLRRRCTLEEELDGIEVDAKEALTYEGEYDYLFHSFYLCSKGCGSPIKREKALQLLEEGKIKPVAHLGYWEKSDDDSEGHSFTYGGIDIDLEEAE